MRNAIAIRVAFAATALSVVAGCGGPEVNIGSGSDAPLPDGPPAEAAGTICTQVDERFAEAQSVDPATFAQGEQVLESLVEIALEGEDRLVAVGPPEGEDETFRRYLDARGEVVALLERAREAAAAEDGTAYERAREAAVAGASERAKLAAQAGLAVCARLERG